MPLPALFLFECARTRSQLLFSSPGASEFLESTNCSIALRNKLTSGLRMICVIEGEMCKVWIAYDLSLKGKFLASGVRMICVIEEEERKW